MSGFNIEQLEGVLKEFDFAEEAGFDSEKEHEVQTDKALVKIVPCLECGRPLVVSTFYVAANARCSDCGATGGGKSKTKGSIAVPQAGRTDPAKAKVLESCLVNPQFAKALCPVHPDDPEHAMELKSVSHSEHYGPRTLTGYDNAGRPQFREDAVGESVLHQCNKCLATVGYSTQVVVNLRAQNEPTQPTGDPGATWTLLLGERQVEGATA